LGTIDRIDGWFIHTSVHPLSIGIGSVVPRPVAAGAEVRTGEILLLTVLVDHDVVDGAPMARFIQVLSENVEGGLGLPGAIPPSRRISESQGLGRNP
ncbi:MAG TPA: 2-oxo acid dehydrogenase subunit E2, partial [Candidatus Aminicenantes bacterium]|nr:2-oxo acid dehydrogenase subunit E2 [Candidatus Aminicenantes bacterium]